MQINQHTKTERTLRLVYLQKVSTYTNHSFAHLSDRHTDQCRRISPACCSSVAFWHIYTAMDLCSYELKSQKHSCSAQGSHTLALKKFQDFSRVFLRTFVTFSGALMLKINDPFSSFVGIDFCRKLYSKQFVCKIPPK